MNIELILESTEPSLLIIEERPRKDIVIGVPHHAPAGKATLPCREHSVSDENAGFLGRYTAEKIGCCSLIACNYTLDVNKSAHSDYSMQIARWNPKVLVEIHGHGANNARYDVEISSGSSEHSRFSTALAQRLTALLSDYEDLRTLTICGEYGKIYFKASGSVTITDGRWLGYHIELPPELRKASADPGAKPPLAGYQFCDALVKVLEELRSSGGN